MRAVSELGRALEAAGLLDLDRAPTRQRVEKSPQACRGVYLPPMARTDLSVHAVDHHRYSRRLEAALEADRAARRASVASRRRLAAGLYEQRDPLGRLWTIERMEHLGNEWVARCTEARDLHTDPLLTLADATAAVSVCTTR